MPTIATRTSTGSSQPRGRRLRGGVPAGGRGGPAAADVAIGPDAAEFEARYRVLGSRDRRFDGRFFVAVTSTGIYCRPSCPAIVPKRRNVRFYPTAAAAQGAGFRACLRCHPHAAPGSPEWNARGDLAARAMALISDGVVDREGVAGLARRLAYSERHLTRQLTAELGAGPLALARAQRAQTARMLIQTSELRLIDVAYAAGFSSVRQFNDTIRAAYGRTPTELRRRGSELRQPVPGLRRRAAEGSRNGAARTPPAEGIGTRPPRSTPTPGSTARNGHGAIESAPRHGATGSEAGPGTIAVRLSYREPLDWMRLLGFLAARAVAGVEEVRDGVYRRALRLPRGHGVVELSAPIVRGREQPHIQCALRLADLRDLSAAVQRCRRLLDLDADPAAPAELLAGDALLGPLVQAAPGLRVPGAADGAELAVRAVLGQQVSVAAARTAAGRLVQAFGDPLPASDGALTHLFPAPAAIADADPAQLAASRAVGPAGRRASLHALARALAEGDIAIDAGSDRDEVRARLLALPGIGPWTERYIAMRGLCDPDAFLPSDIGVRRALERLGALDTALGGPAASAATARLAERWRPWRAYALQYLWASLALAPGAALASGAPPATAAGAVPAAAAQAAASAASAGRSATRSR